MKQKALFLLLLFTSCTAALDPSLLPSEKVIFKGVVDMDLEENYLIGGSDNQEIESHITVAYQKSKIIFTSSRYAFDANLSAVFGNMECEAYIYTGDQAYKQEGIHYLEFLPERDFWECLEYDFCAHGDEVFSFVLYLKDMESS